MTRRRLVILAVGMVSCGLVAMPVQTAVSRRIVFNTTASAPLGFYWQDKGRASVGDLVAVQPPPILELWLARRGYLPLRTPLIKSVAAAGGQRVCGRRGVVSIDGRPVVEALPRDRVGRAMPQFQGCIVLAQGEVFLLNPSAPRSLDSRYFGPLPRSSIDGRLRPFWTWQ